MPTREDDRVGVVLELARARAAVDPRARAETRRRAPRAARASSGSGSLHLAVRRDRVADEAADLLALVVDRDGVAARGELAGAGEPGGAGADDGDAPAVRAARASRSGSAVLEGPVRRVALQRADLDRRAGPRATRTQAPWHSTSTGQTRAHVPPRRFSAKIVAAAAAGLAGRDRGDEARDVDAGRAGDHARRGGVRPAALEAAVGLDDGFVAVSGGRSSRVSSGTLHSWVQSPGAPVRDGIGVGTEVTCGKAAATPPYSPMAGAGRRF